MNWIKYSMLATITALMLIVVVFLTDFVAKKALGLGEPIVYDHHPLWGYSPRANRTYSRFDGDSVAINNVGARSSNDWSANGNNIVFLGDSVTYGGSYINDDQTFASLVCKSIDNWVCHNAGVNSYGILNMVARSRYDERINTAPVRVFTFITEDLDRGLRNSNTAHFILRELPSVLNGLWEILNYVAASISPKNWFGKKSDLVDAELLADARDKNQKFARDVLLTELDRLEESGQKFLLVHSPSLSELEDPELIAKNIVLSDLQHRYPNRFIYLRNALIDPYKNNVALLFKDSVHFEEQGHLEVANYLTPRLLNLISNH